MTNVGLWENVKIRHPNKGAPWRRFEAKFDTGAATSRIGKKKAEILRLGPVIDRRWIRTGSGRVLRKVVRARVQIAGHQVTTEFTISNTRTGVNIGRNTMGTQFRVSPSQKHLTEP